MSHPPLHLFFGALFEIEEGSKPIRQLRLGLKLKTLLRLSKEQLLVPLAAAGFEVPAACPCTELVAGIVVAAAAAAAAATGLDAYS